MFRPSVQCSHCRADLSTFAKVGTLGMKLWEFFWAPAIEILDTDSLPLAFELSGRNRKKRILSWVLGEECVEVPCELPPSFCPKSFDPMAQVLSAHCFLPISHRQELLTGPPALESVVWPSLGIVVSHSVVLILPLCKWGGIICILIADNPYKCHLSPCGLSPLCCSSSFTILVLLDLPVQCKFHVPNCIRPPYLG